MDQSCQGKRSKKTASPAGTPLPSPPNSKPIDTMEPPQKPFNTRTHLFFMTIIKISGMLFSNQSGGFPITYNRGNKYVIMFYIYNANFVKSVPIKSWGNDQLKQPPQQGPHRHSHPIVNQLNLWNHFPRNPSTRVRTLSSWPSSRSPACCSVTNQASSPSLLAEATSTMLSSTFTILTLSNQSQSRANQKLGWEMHSKFHGIPQLIQFRTFWTPEFSSEFIFLIVKCVPANSEHISSGWESSPTIDSSNFMNWKTFPPWVFFWPAEKNIQSFISAGRPGDAYSCGFRGTFPGKAILLRII